MKSKKLTFVFIALLFLFNPLCSLGQIEKFSFIRGIDLTRSTQSIIKDLLSDNSVQVLFLDTSTSVFPQVMYRTDKVDSVEIKFYKEHLSSISFFFSDSCLFNYIKVICLENFKISKGSANKKKQLYDGNDYLITLYETKGINNSKYGFLIRSKKYKIKI